MESHYNVYYKACAGLGYMRAIVLAITTEQIATKQSEDLVDLKCTTGK